MKSIIERILLKVQSKNIQKNEVIRIEDVRSFERNNNIKLPEELVLFYTEVCNGCKMLDGFNLLRMDEWKYNANSLKIDFHLRNTGYGKITMIRKS